MNKKAIIITVSSLLLLAAGVGAFFYFRNKNKDESNTSDTTDKGDSGLTADQVKDLIDKATKEGGALGTVDESEYSSKNPIAGHKQLKFGNKGRNIAMLQALLNHYYGRGIAIDGAFGNQTRNALIGVGFKFRRCVPSATACEVLSTEFVEMLNKTKTK